jgi:hypothetical protein
MTKKSLFFGAAALALLVLLTIVGCSNPASESTEYVTQAGSEYPYPADTVFVNTRNALNGLLNDYSAETNRVTNIAYTGVINPELVIPTGKVLYYIGAVAGSPTTLAANVIVEQGARLVLVGEITTGGGKILTHGAVEVFRSLTVGVDARDVADYTVENNKVIGRNTAIGKIVTVLPGATLTLDASDIIPPDQYSENKFTPTQAWAAAGQGHLIINGTLNAYPYTVKELLTGVYPSATRRYTVTSGRYSTETLPALIPQGAFITTSAIPVDSEGNTLTVNGSLTTKGTLNDLTRIEVGNGGSLSLTESAGELVKGLADLKIGPGGSFAVASPDVSLKSLATLFLGDGSSISVTGGNVTFKEDADLALTMGKKVMYGVAVSASATVDTVISGESGLAGGSNLVVHPGSTFTVGENATFTVDSGATFDISRQPLGQETPAVVINGAIEIEAGGSFIGPDFATVQADPGALFETVNLGTDGKVVLNWGGIFQLGAGPEALVGPGGTAARHAYEWNTTNDGGQIEINAGGIIIRDINDITASPVTVTIGGQGGAILSTQTLTLDRGVTLAVTATSGADSFYLLGAPADTNGVGGGAKLLGPGKLTLGAGATAISIVGGDYGWQAVGHDLAFFATGAGAGTVHPINIDPSPTGPWETTLKALGLGATITVPAGANLTIGRTLLVATSTTIDLGGTSARKSGEITLGASTGTITLAVATTAPTVTSAIITGNDGGASPFTAELAGTGGLSEVNPSGTPAVALLGVPGLVGPADLTAIGDDTQAATTGVYTAGTPNNTLSAGYLVSLKPGTVTGGTNTVKGGASGGTISAETATAGDS